MPSRASPFVNEYIYHIYNRGSEKRRIYSDRRDYSRFIKTIRYYQVQGPKPKLSYFKESSRLDFSKRIIDILAYCLMPNHFHLLVKQAQDRGITEFMGKLSNSYTKYYNVRTSRIGPLFQGEFKSVLIEDDEQLLHVQRYIHLNPLVSLLTKDLKLYEWSSYLEYTSDVDNGFCSTEDILGYLTSPEQFREFVMDQIDHAKNLEAIKHACLELPG